MLWFWLHLETACSSIKCSFFYPSSTMSKIFWSVFQCLLLLCSAYHSHLPKQQAEVIPSELFMSCLVSQKDKHQEIIFEACLVKDKVRRGVTERVWETDTKHEGREWRQKRQRKTIGAIHQSHPSDNATAWLHFPPLPPRHPEAGQEKEK